MMGVPDTLVFPPISLLHLGRARRCWPDINGVIFWTDASAHHSMARGVHARAGRRHRVGWSSATTTSMIWRARLVGRSIRAGEPKIIATDGVYSMGSPNPPLAAYARLAREYNATVYVDDAHGFGVVSADPDEALSHTALRRRRPRLRHSGARLYERDLHHLCFAVSFQRRFPAMPCVRDLPGRCEDEALMLQTSGPIRVFRPDRGGVPGHCARGAAPQPARWRRAGALAAIFIV